MNLLAKLVQSVAVRRRLRARARAAAVFPAQVAEVLRTVPGILSAEPRGDFCIQVAIAPGLASDVALEEAWSRLYTRWPDAWVERVRRAFVACIEAAPQLDLAALPELEASLDQVPWFAHVREPLDPSIQGPSSWDDLPGPEDFEDLGTWQQEMLDGMVGVTSEDSRVEQQLSNPLTMVFQRVCDRVVVLAAKTVPYEPGEDAWHAPNLAVWHAGWTAALVALCLVTRRVLPPALEAQWEWFRRGRWPYAIAGARGSVPISEWRNYRVF